MCFFLLLTFLILLVCVVYTSHYTTGLSTHAHIRRSKINWTGIWLKNLYSLLLVFIAIVTFFFVFFSFVPSTKKNDYLVKYPSQMLWLLSRRPEEKKNKISAQKININIYRGRENKKQTCVCDCVCARWDFENDSQWKTVRSLVLRPTGLNCPSIGCWL